MLLRDFNRSLRDVLSVCENPCSRRSGAFSIKSVGAVFCIVHPRVMINFLYQTIIEGKKFSQCDRYYQVFRFLVPFIEGVPSPDKRSTCTYTCSDLEGYM